MREQALSMLYESVKDRVRMARDEFAAVFDGWNVYPLTQRGEVIGAFVECAGEVHVGYGVKPAGSILRQIKGIFTPLLKEQGELRTKVDEANARGLEFCRRLGFQEVRREGGIVFMRCERCNYA